MLPRCTGALRLSLPAVNQVLLLSILAWMMLLSAVFLPKLVWMLQCVQTRADRVSSHSIACYLTCTML